MLARPIAGARCVDMATVRVCSRLSGAWVDLDAVLSRASVTLVACA